MSLAVELMKSPKIKMHGPEHHFLVPAVLLAAYCNLTGNQQDKADKIKTARNRADYVKGGFCGLHGACGAAVGTGIFVSLLTGATPLSGREWKLSNLITSQCLKEIAEHGGPRCCKRDTFLAIINAIDFIKEYFDTDMAINRGIKCQFSTFNRECRKEQCPFFNQGR
jgi:hypothetical protein